MQNLRIDLSNKRDSPFLNKRSSIERGDPIRDSQSFFPKKSKQHPNSSHRCSHFPENIDRGRDAASRTDRKQRRANLLPRDAYPVSVSRTIDKTFSAFPLDRIQALCPPIFNDREITMRDITIRKIDPVTVSQPATIVVSLFFANVSW